MEDERSKMFKCEQCGDEFQQAWDDEAAIEEFNTLFPNEDLSKSKVVCEDCYNILMGFSPGVPN